VTVAPPATGAGPGEDADADTLAAYRKDRPAVHKHPSSRTDDGQ
jgi:hypothetical protein